MESYIESDFSKINENILGKINMEERNINESLLFNSDLLEQCRTFSPRIVQSLNGYGKLVENELQLIFYYSLKLFEYFLNSLAVQRRSN